MALLPEGLTAPLGRHWPMTVLTAVGLVLRVLTWLAYQPALLYIDSFRYLDNLSLRPDQLAPIGYDLVLVPLLRLGGLHLVTAVQHVVGLSLGVALYALALRLGVGRWAAAVAAAPVLLDGYQLQIEQTVMAEVWFQALLVGMVWLLLGRERVGWAQAGAAGLVVGATVLVRVIGITLALPLAWYLLTAGGTWRGPSGWRRVLSRTAAGGLGLLLVVGGYAAYFTAVTGQVGLTIASGNVLYGRAATVADCSRLALTPTLRQLCPTEPLGQRLGVDAYAHLQGVPGRFPALPPGLTAQQAMQQFGVAVLRAQPWDVARGVLKDFAKGFAWSKTTSKGDVPVDRWQFQESYPVFESTDPVALTRKYDGMAPTVQPGLAHFLRRYQLGVGYTPGTLLALAGLLALIGSARSQARQRVAALFVVASATTLLLGAAAFEFSWRYQLPGLVLLPLAGAVGWSALTSPARPRLAAFPDETDRIALRTFHERYGRPQLATVVIVVAAYNEEANLAQVLRAVPPTCSGLPIDVLVVVDGATDRTATIAGEHGCYVCEGSRNRGQGAALRLGYQLATELGGRYVVTTDADGQYDMDELPMLLHPIVAGTADFASGSRRLGQEESDSWVRWLGVRFFATLASVLTGQRFTDTSFGFRAMRVQLLREVTLHEPQYQSAELLLAMRARGARMVEVPMTMRRRASGRSKKGHSLVYGFHYARVMTGTWWRERARRQRSGAALGGRTG